METMELAALIKFWERTREHHKSADFVFDLLCNTDNDSGSLH